MPRLIMLKGLVASGKTTWAKAKVLEHPVNSYKRVNKDDIRAMLDCGRYSKGAEKIVLSVRDTIIEEALLAGHNVIVDDTNLNPKHEKDLRELAEDCFCKFEIKLFPASLYTCIKRNEERLNPVPHGVIVEMFYRYISGRGL